VLQFSGDEKSSLRLLRPQKNRFSSIDEVGIFAMKERGLQSVENPGEYFLSGEGADGKNNQEQIGACRSIILEGARPIIVEVQALSVSTNYPYPKRVAEGISLSRLQLLTAVANKYLNLKLYEQDIYINVANGLKVSDRSIDLAIIAAIISSAKSKPIIANTIVFGEINLSGQVSRTSFEDKRSKECRRLGYKNIVHSTNTRNIRNLQGHLFA
jgi:DNA repair protein RadA/Sms